MEMTAGDARSARGARAANDLRAADDARAADGAPAAGARLADLLGDSSRRRLAGTILGRLLSAGAIGRLLARMLRSPMRARRPTTALTRTHARLLRRGGGRVRRSWLFAAGQPVMALTTIGRRSGARRTTPVTAFACEGRLAAAAMNLGMERSPAWAYNLQANPEAWITLAGRTVAVRARMADGDERERLWARWLQLQPSSRAFAALAGRTVPMFVFERRDERAGQRSSESLT